MKFQLILPRNITFGVGAFTKLGDLCSPLGNSALLVTGKSAMRRSAKLEQAKELLESQGLRLQTFEGVEADPSLATCDKGIKLARKSQCDLIIAIGGGSALDAGKTVAAIAPQPEELPEYFAGERELENAPLPFVAVPTTAGTGSECTNNAVLTDTERCLKKSLRHRTMVPTVALVDPELTLGLTPDVTAHSGMDALTQAIECHVGMKANPVSDALTLKAIQLIAAHLADAVADGSRIENREPVALGSMLTGMAFANAGLGAVHGLAGPLGAILHAPHGLVCAVLLSHVCALNLSARKDKFDAIATSLGSASAEQVPEVVRQLNRRVGIPDTLRDFGLKKDSFDKILAECRSGSMANNPKQPSDDELTAILRKIM